MLIVSVLDRNIVTLLIGPIQQDLGLSDVQSGLILGLAFALPYGLMALPFGAAVDRYPRRFIIYLGVSIWSIATVCTGFVRSFEALFIARAGVGAGEASLSPAQQSLLSDLFPSERLALPVSVSSMGLKVGQGAALLLGGALTLLFLPTGTFDVPVIGEMRGWAIIFVLIGLPGVLLATMIFLIPEPARHSPLKANSGEGTRFADYLSIMKRNAPFYACHHLGLFAVLTCSTGITGWAPTYFERVHDWPHSLTGVWLGMAMLAGPVMGMPLHGYIVDRVYRSGVTDFHLRYASMLVLLSIPVGVAAFLVPNPYWAAVLIGLFFFAVTVYTSIPIVCLQIRLPSRMRGKASSIVSLLPTTLGTIAGPLLVGTLTDTVFQDRQHVGMSIVTCLVILGPLSALLFRAGAARVDAFRLEA